MPLRFRIVLLIANLAVFVFSLAVLLSLGFFLKWAGMVATLVFGVCLAAFFIGHRLKVGYWIRNFDNVIKF